MANNNPYLAPLQFSGLARYGLQAGSGNPYLGLGDASTWRSSPAGPRQVYQAPALGRFMPDAAAFLPPAQAVDQSIGAGGESAPGGGGTSAADSLGPGGSSALGNLGLTPGQGFAMGNAVAGPMGGLVGATLGIASQSAAAADSTNPSSVNAVNGMDAQDNAAVAANAEASAAAAESTASNDGTGSLGAGFGLGGYGGMDAGDGAGAGGGGGGK